jgi:5-methylcytosine-specific restriction protein A
VPRAPKKCGRAGCEERVVGRIYCPADTPAAWGTSRRPGSTRAGRKLRAQVLARDQVCTCNGCPKCSMPFGCERPATEDDHLVNLAGGGSDDPRNHAGKCPPCHQHKTQVEAQRARGLA